MTKPSAGTTVLVGFAPSGVSWSGYGPGGPVDAPAWSFRGAPIPYLGGDANTVHVIDAAGVENWPRLDKDEVARRLTLRIADHFKKADA